MASNALVQTRIDAEVKERATAVLEGMGLTVSNAVRILLTRIANEGALPLELVSNSDIHDAWFRAKVLQALEDTRPDVEDADAEGHFARRRGAALRKPRRASVEARMGAACALRSRRHLHAYRSRKSEIGRHVDQQVVHAARRLVDFLEAGDSVGSPARELVISRTPYIAAYTRAARHRQG